MAVENFLKTYKEAMMNKRTINPLTGKTTPVADPQVRPGYGARVQDWLQGRTSNALNTYITNKSKTTTDLASKYTDMAAGNIPTDEWGIPTNKLSNFTEAFTKQLTTARDYGKSALATEEAKARWQSLQNQAELAAGYQINWAPGASSNNAGAKAVSIALSAQGTPYQWGGNSLTRGVDCSGLVQQVYSQMGIKLPRTTYEQAKSGKIVSLSNLLPGDLVFYNTGGRDPNGIGQLSHVGIYIGNGQIVHAPGRGKTVRIASINNPGTPVRAVRPW